MNIPGTNIQVEHTKAFRQKATNSNENCCVYGCKSVRKKNTDLMYHRLPRPGQKIEIKNDFGRIELQERKIWEINLRMGKKITNSMKVCSLHFTEYSYTCSGWSSIKCLKRTAVPSENCPTQSYTSVRNKSRIREFRRNARQERCINRQAQTQKSSYCSLPFTESHTGQESANVEVTVTAEEPSSNKNEDVHQEAVAGLLLLGQSKPSLKIYKEASVQVNVEKKDVAVQVDTSEMLTICDFVKTDKELSSCIGVNSFQLLNTLVSLLANFVIDNRIHRLSLYKRVFLTLMKIKLDLPYVILSILFGVSSQTCKTIFFETVSFLTPLLKCAIVFPSREEIQLNMPKCFENVKKVRIVLDCTEVAFQRHQRLCCRIKCYSHYKGMTTFKFMTGVTPAGLISYVSPAFGGRTSDKAIFESSGLLDKLDMFQDKIMIDKGFLIESVCDSFGIGLVRPPFLRKKKKFSQAEAIETAKIASARVHIERSNQRIKTFKILANRSPANLIPIADNIFVIVCALVNLSSPILADDKFIE